MNRKRRSTTNKKEAIIATKGFEEVEGSDGKAGFEVDILSPEPLNLVRDFTLNPQV